MFRVLIGLLLSATLLISSHAMAVGCAKIESWTGCYLNDNDEACNSKVVKMDFTNAEGKTMSQWIGKTDIRKNPELKAHVSEMMRNFMAVNSYLDSHCSDGPCLTGHEHICH